MVDHLGVVGLDWHGGARGGEPPCAMSYVGMLHRQSYVGMLHRQMLHRHELCWNVASTETVRRRALYFLAARTLLPIAKRARCKWVCSVCLVPVWSGS